MLDQEQYRHGVFVAHVEQRRDGMLLVPPKERLYFSSVCAKGCGVSEKVKKADKSKICERNMCMEFKENAITTEIYHELRSSVEWMNFNVEQTAQGLSHSLYSLAVFDAEKPIGMGRIVGDGIYNIICDVVVNPDYQEKGIGTEIIRRLLYYLKEQTPDNGRSSIQLIAESGKEKFYEKFGFETVPNEASGSGMRMIIRK